MRATTVEQTGKTWKAAYLIGIVSSAAGIAIAILYASWGGWVVGVAGLAVAFASRIGAWWWHG